MQYGSGALAPSRGAVVRVTALVMLFGAASGQGGDDCSASSNTDTNSQKECKYLKPCTKNDVPAAPAQYTMECETMPCPADQDIMFDRQEGTDLGELYAASCDTTVQMCRDKCEQTFGCCGFNFQFNPGQYAAKVGRCVAKACDGRIVTSRYGMVYYQREAGAVTSGAAPPMTPAPSDDDGSGMLVGIIIGVVLLLGVVAAVVIKKKSSSNAVQFSEKYQEMPPPAGAGGATKM